MFQKPFSRSGRSLIALSVLTFVTAQAMPAFAEDQKQAKSSHVEQRQAPHGGVRAPLGNEQRPVANAMHDPRAVAHDPRVADHHNAVHCPCRSDIAGFHDRDVHHFDAAHLARWRGGGWHEESFNGRYGHWWVVDGVHYYYPAPVYPYPLIISADFVEEAPPAVVAAVPMAPPAPPPLIQLNLPALFLGIH